MFQTLRKSLILELQRRIQNGEFTERAMARYLGVSQPHIHNVLAGKRALTIELADHIIVRLRIPWESLWKKN